MSDGDYVTGFGDTPVILNGDRKAEKQGSQSLVTFLSILFTAVEKSDGVILL